MHWAVRIARDSALELVVFNGIGAGIAVAGLLFLGGTLIPDFGFVILLESVALMLVGGALDLTTRGSIRVAVRQLNVIFRSKTPERDEELAPDQRRRLGTTAATYAVTGILLFVEAGMLTLAFV